MALKGFTFDSALIDAFVRFGYDHYRDDPGWIPPFEAEIRVQLAPAFFFYRQPGNAHRHFLATVSGRAVGRISAMANRDLKNRDGTPVGCVGFFESVKDPAVAKDLLDAAVGWLRGEHGLRRIWGPMNFDIWHGYRFMTRGFSEKLFMGEPYNKPYYPDLFERHGFAPLRRWYSVEIAECETFEHLQVWGADRYRELVDRGYRFEQFDHKRFPQELCKLHSVLTRSFSGFFGFTPISLPEFERLYALLHYAVDPRMFLFAYDEERNLCGFAAALLDLSDAIRAMNGRSTLLAKAKFACRRWRVDRVMFHLVGRTPEEARKRTGLGRALSATVLRGIVAQGYKSSLATLFTPEGRALRGAFHDLAANAGRQYTLFELNP